MIISNKPVPTVAEEEEEKDPFDSKLELSDVEDVEQVSDKQASEDDEVTELGPSHEAGDDELVSSSSQLTKTPATGSKRVSFGPYLSPEQFDMTMPPASPVKKGATPRRSMRIGLGLKKLRPSVAPVEEEVQLWRNSNY